MPRKIGRPPHVRTKETATLVELGVAHGTPFHDIAKIIGIGAHQLRREYKHELETAKIRARLKMGGKLYNMAMGGNIAAIIFWLKCQAGWRETPQRHEWSGPDGGPIPVATANANMTDDDAMKAYLRMVKGDPK